MNELSTSKWHRRRDDKLSSKIVVGGAYKLTAAAAAELYSHINLSKWFLSIFRIYTSKSYSGLTFWILSIANNGLALMRHTMKLVIVKLVITRLLLYKFFK